MNVQRILFVFIVALIPMRAEAKQSTFWDFRTDFTAQRWMTNGNVQLTSLNDGLLFATQEKEATLRKIIDISHPIDVLYITYKTGRSVNVKMGWESDQLEENEVYRMPVTLPPTQAFHTAGADFSILDEWNRHPNTLEIFFPPRSELVIQSIEVVGYSPIDKFGEFLKGLWKFDDYRPYTINFVWGPHMAFNPVARKHMFLSLPPVVHSANSVLYSVLAIGLLSFWGMQRVGKWTKKHALTMSMLLIGGMWIAYDIRMGTEFLSYVKDDYQSYHSQPIGARTFRERSFFNDFAKAIVPIVDNKGEYIFMGEYEWPYVGILKYETYPNVPVTPYDGNANKIDTWIVYRRPTVTLNSNGQLVENGQVLSPPGTMLHEFAAGTFIFQTQL